MQAAFGAPPQYVFCGFCPFILAQVFGFALCQAAAEWLAHILLGFGVADDIRNFRAVAAGHAGEVCVVHPWVLGV